jgi:hypothetical protein
VLVDRESVKALAQSFWMLLVVVEALETAGVYMVK